MRRPADLLAAGEALVTLTAAAVAVRALPYRRVARLFRLQEGPAPAGPVDAATAARVEWAVAAAGRRLPFTTTCLMRATAGSALLRHRHQGSEVTLGVAKVPAGDGFAAHAWLSCGEAVLTGAAERPDFSPVARYHAG